MATWQVQTLSAELGDVANAAHRQTLTKPVTDALQCRVLIVVGNGGFCLVTLDVTEIPPHPVTELRRAVAQATGLPLEAVWLGVTHTHAGFMPNELDMEALREVILRTVAGAQGNGSRATQAGFAWVDTGHRFAVNRRAEAPHAIGRFSNFQPVHCVDDGRTVDAIGWMRDWLAGCGADECELAALTGAAPLDRPADGRLQLILLGHGDRPVAGIVKFSAHAVVLSGGYWRPNFSRDFCGALLDRLERHWGCPMLFLQGLCGDQRARHRQCSPAERDRIGFGLADLLAPERAAVEWAALDSVQTQSRMVSCATFPGLADDLADLEARQLRSRAELDSCPHGLEQLARRKGLAERLKHLEALDLFVNHWGYLTPAEVQAGRVDLEVSALGLGPWTVVAAPGEMCSPAALELQSALGDGTIPCSYVNGTICYILDAADCSRGGYESYTSLIAPQATGQLVQAARELCCGQQPAEKVAL